MNRTFIDDKKLDALLSVPGPDIEDNGFSAAVISRIKRRSILAAMIPAVSGLFGALISIYALPDGWVPSVIHKLTEQILGASPINSSELLLFMTRYGIEPSLFWFFLAVPLFILPFALHQD